MNAVINGMPAAAISDVTWRKSQRSGAQGNCVEVAHLPSGDVALRNSRDPDGPALIYTRDEMAAFIAGAKGGEFDTATPAADSSADAGHGARTSALVQATATANGAIAAGTTASSRTTSRYRSVGLELQDLAEKLLAGDVVLDREDAERLLRVLGAAVLLHRMHRVDSHGRCSVCRTKSRFRWHPSSQQDICSVYAAFGLHIGRFLTDSAARHQATDTVAK